MTDIHIETVIAASPKTIYTCWTFPVLLARWLCNRSVLTARAGGAYSFVWQNGTWASGTFSAAEPEKQLAFSWHEADAPGATHITVDFAAVGTTTRVTLTQTGFGSGAAWDSYRETQLAAWSRRLDDLRTLAEIGTDARVMRRPVLNINVIPISSDEAARHGLPVNHAVNITGIEDGSPEYVAGLRRGDFIVSIAGQPMATFGDLSKVLDGRQAGDIVPVDLYRDGVRHSIDVALQARPPVTLPETRDEVARQVEQHVTAVTAELDALFDGVPETALNVRPMAGEWSAREVLAHLVWTEHWVEQALWLMSTVGTQMEWGYNNDFELSGLLATHDAAALRTELHRALHAQHAMAVALPEDVLANKPLFVLLALWLQGTGEHCREHYDQLRAAITHAQSLPTDTTEGNTLS